MLLAMAGSLTSGAQTLEKMNWFNEPVRWAVADGRLTMSVTHHTSDWSVIALDKHVKEIWIKAVRRTDAIEIFYSFDDKEYTLMRHAWMEANRPVKVGMMGASPDGDGFSVTFSDFTVRHLPDKVRTDWLHRTSATQNTADTTALP